MKRSLLMLVALLAASGCGYNRIQELDESVNAAAANIDTELMRRNDLIPNLVATVDEAASFEQETQTRVAEARAGLSSARDQLAQAADVDADMQTLSQANAAVSEQLRAFLNVSVEAYPTLNANQNFIALQDELTATENRIAVARRDYNEAVQVYNTYVRRFPQTVTAKVIGADTRPMFEAPEGAQTAPAVEFGRGGGG